MGRTETSSSGPLWTPLRGEFPLLSSPRGVEQMDSKIHLWPCCIVNASSWKADVWVERPNQGSCSGTSPKALSLVIPPGLCYLRGVTSWSLLRRGDRSWAFLCSGLSRGGVGIVGGPEKDWGPGHALSHSGRQGKKDTLVKDLCGDIAASKVKEVLYCSSIFGY